MKKFISIIVAVTAFTALSAQQIPISESYFLDRYSFAPSYAGNFNSKFLFLGYRSDWSGIEGGPKTFRLSFNNSFMKNAGYGVKMIYDRAGIFDQLYALASYSYRVNINEDHKILFGISAGIYRNTLNISDYYSDPNYNLDPSLINQNVKSKLKFMSDASAVWKWNRLETGFMFTNISFGDAGYDEVDVTYKPLANFQIHALYDFSVSEKLNLIPIVVVRGGKYIKSQYEIATQILYQQKVWLSLAYRDPGIIGAGVGASIGKSLKISYNFNFASDVAMNVFNNHEINLGFNIFELAGKK
ncbi:MAG: PorP/SprF family type IX secretion system membrane protein [Bacteroidales bacterium]|nr:PorP/SprF family type IX secretion system membrane protein [Bacteroidales bacterium]